MEKIRVALSQRVEIVPSYGEVRDCLDQEWTTLLNSLSLFPIPIPNKTADVASYCNTIGISAIFLTGGNNLASARYDGTPPDPLSTSANRDVTEHELIDFSINRGLPLLGWCRGLQSIQTYFNGVLSSTKESSIEHTNSLHEVMIKPNRFVNSTETKVLTVNSFHDFGVKRDQLAPPLIELATSQDGFVEGLYHPDLPIIAFQWHPERTQGPDDLIEG